MMLIVDYREWVEEAGRRIRKARIEKGMTLRELATQTELAEYTITRLEAGKNPKGGPISPQLATWAKVAKALDISVDELYPPPYPAPPASIDD